MYREIQRAVMNWAGDMDHLVRTQLMDLDPHEYCVGAVLVIAIGYVLLQR